MKNILRLFRRSETHQPKAMVGDDVVFEDLKDPRLALFLRAGAGSVTGEPFSVEQALRNPAMFRAWSLISNVIGMLPTHLIHQDTNEKAKEHPLYKILHRRPNGYQSAFDFKSLMQGRALSYGDGFARIVRSRDVRTGKDRVVALLPFDEGKVEPRLNAGMVDYRVQGPNGKQLLSSREVFHLRGVTLDGVNGVSTLRQAWNAVTVALQAELATGRLLKNGTFTQGALKAPNKLSDEAYRRLKESLSDKEGARNAGKNLILEEGLDFTDKGSTARDAQLGELRKLQVEEVARATGVPRPLLMADETSWGSGIEALGQFFVAYALNPWFEAWQQAAERSLLDDDEQDEFAVKFNPGALLRGSLKDQADYLSKALGAGGHQPWMYADEARDTMDMRKRAAPPNLMMGQPPKTDGKDDDAKV